MEKNNKKKSNKLGIFSALKSIFSNGENVNEKNEEILMEIERIEKLQSERISDLEKAIETHDVITNKNKEKTKRITEKQIKKIPNNNESKNKRDEREIGE